MPGGQLETMSVDTSIEEFCYKMEQKIITVIGEESGLKRNSFLRREHSSMSVY